MFQADFSDFINLLSLRSKQHTYDDVVEKVAEKLGLDDPSKLRLTSHNCYSQQPKPQPIKYRGVDHLSDMLVHYNQVIDVKFSILYLFVLLYKYNTCLLIGFFFFSDV